VIKGKKRKKSISSLLQGRGEGVATEKWRKSLKKNQLCQVPERTKESKFPFNEKEPRNLPRGKGPNDFLSREEGTTSGEKKKESSGEGKTQ